MFPLLICQTPDLVMCMEYMENHFLFSGVLGSRLAQNAVISRSSSKQLLFLHSATIRWKFTATWQALLFSTSKIIFLLYKHESQVLLLKHLPLEIGSLFSNETKTSPSSQHLLNSSMTQKYPIQDNISRLHIFGRTLQGLLSIFQKYMIIMKGSDCKSSFQIYTLCRLFSHRQFLLHIITQSSSLSLHVLGMHLERF